MRPPSSIPPERLFRLMLGTPRPSQPLTYRIHGVEHVPLEVRALRPLEEAAVIDRVAVQPEHERPSAYAAHLVSAALWTPTGRAFPSADAVGELYGDEADHLAREVLDALDIVSPSYRWSDVAAWTKTLEQGARHASNASMTFALGGCAEVGWRYSARPDWYFGMPIGELTDGHWMAFRAAREVVAQMEKKRG